ncbi:hypothetical protein [Microaceticoccus formicicus]|uniref:hypothetical protein n=1 Tax=Microaceticoccus formicicus TaxID=3118105 RepID=UPI003CD0046F|nr:hypothetical protein VZL98_04880 [Peptoniphilaceae bacterium AMB_02]
MNVIDLKKQRDETFKVWFERWWRNEEIEKKIIIANAKGYTKYEHRANMKQHQRLTDPNFKNAVRDKIAGINVYVNVENIGTIFDVLVCSVYFKWEDQK